MISGFGMIANAFRPQQATSGAAAERSVAQQGAGNLAARDTIARREQGKKARDMINAKVATHKIAILPQKVATKKKA